MGEFKGLVFMLCLVFAACHGQKETGTQQDENSNSDVAKVASQEQSVQTIHRLQDQLYGWKYNEEQRRLFWEMKWKGQKVAFSCLIAEISREKVKCHVVEVHGSENLHVSEGSELHATFARPLGVDLYLSIRNGSECTIRGFVNKHPTPLEVASGMECNRRRVCVSIELEKAESPADCASEDFMP